MIQACYDCPFEIEGKRVEFKPIDYDIDNVSLAKLRSDPKLREQTKYTLRQIQYVDRNDPLYAWYSPPLTKEVNLNI